MSENISSSNISEQLPSIDLIKAGMRATWMSGDFGKIAEHMEGIAEDFARHVHVSAGDRVLDVACGSGNVSLPLARMGADVTGVDIAPNLLQTARQRAEAANLSITFDEGDAESLPYADASFDVVVSMFGAMFAPRPELVVKEMARVLKPGGRIAMANWTLESFTADIFRTTSKHVKPIPGIASPLQWGDKAVVTARLSQEFTNVQAESTAISFDFPMSPVEASGLFREFYGPTKTAFAKLDEEGQHALGEDLDSLWAGAAVARPPAAQDGSDTVLQEVHASSEDQESHTWIPNEYLYVTATRA